MKSLLGLNCLLTAAFSMPQQRTGPTDNLLHRLITSPRNPCGEPGVLPECRCKSDPSFKPSPLNHCPQGLPDLICTCKNGEEFDIEEIEKRVRDFAVNSERNPCGVGVDATCTCSNGDIAIFNGGPTCPGSGSPIPTCSCPDGTVIEKLTEFIERGHQLYFEEDKIRNLHKHRNVLRRIVYSPRNPCGEPGVSPECVCKSNRSLKPLPSNENSCPEGLPDVICTCENGEEFDVEEIENRVREFAVESERNPCGVGIDASCTCSNGKIALFNGGPVCPDSSSPIPTCICPDGKEIEKLREFIEIGHQLYFEENIEDLREKLLHRLVNSSRNPCGEPGVHPKCSCKSDSSIEPSANSSCPEGLPDVYCKCENGELYDFGEIENRVRDFVRNSERNPCGVGIDATCTCSNGKIAVFNGGPACPGSSSPLPTCRCPDGTVIQNLRKFIDRGHQLYLKEETYE